MHKAVRTTVLAMGLSLSACASGPYGQSSTVNRTLTGAGAGAAIGGLVGAAAGGSALGGAVVGSVVGGALGAAVKLPNGDKRQYYRDTTGACYYVDREGKPVYVRNVRC
jgi:hypothetical protein